MPVNKAKNHYLGKEGHVRANCAQSIMHAFQEKFDLNEQAIEAFRMYGGGRAPEGLCGALYAAKYLLEQHVTKEKSAEIEQYFLAHAGAVKCREIKMCKKLSCLGCVEKSSEFLVKHVE